MQAHSTLSIKSLPILEQDDVALAVTVLQRLLTLYNYLPNTAINGIFRWETEDAIRQFQHDNGLYADGIVDLHTWSVLADLESPELEPIGCLRDCVDEANHRYQR